jgi:ABC-type Fe3+/spermidine/putrescine transport system ATPase subunit
MVTHDQEEALSVGDRVAVMRDGSIAQVGTPEEVHDRPVDPWVGAFLGHGRLVPMTERDGLAITPLGTVRMATRVPGATQLLVRPEHLQLVPAGTGACDAVVETRRFEGSAVLVVLRAAGIGGLWATCPADQRGLQVGDAVGVLLRDQPPPVAFAVAAAPADR